MLHSVTLKSNAFVPKCAALFLQWFLALCWILQLACLKSCSLDKTCWSKLSVPVHSQMPYRSVRLQSPCWWAGRASWIQKSTPNKRKAPGRRSVHAVHSSGLCNWARWFSLVREGKKTAYSGSGGFLNETEKERDLWSVAIPRPLLWLAQTWRILATAPRSSKTMEIKVMLKVNIQKQKN